MIVAVCALLLAVAPTPAGLRGIDEVPRLEGDAFTAAELWLVVANESVDVVTRARAVRLLPRVVLVSERAAAEARLASMALSSSTPAVLAYDIAIARFDIAVLTSAARARAVAAAAETSPVPTVRQAAALMWWRVGGDAGRMALQRCAAHDVAASVRATCIGRLRAPVSTPVTGAVSDVLHGTSDGDSSTSPGRQLRRAADLPQQR